ncbi:glycosyltransferase family 2 protein [Mucilaginibacter glaciei]|uniref:Glycosyltransferase family 2 protein n=1 Tax=Mucilaginibacter glaciei TaxID=2772109 RepID=A0A926NWV0_9SPHI|nr:glycosyltransferase family 2 protein [Mucilaginibacter glaciei]MBD1393298.1 glycosyltransferase family 2 protein [Mucilaginibacter glaciei]
MVSVIIPNYNHAPYLNDRLNSVLAQTYQDFELIILDDCSTDGSFEIIRRYGNNPKVSHIVVNSANSGGPFHQWKKGIVLAKGDYVWIAESDDWCEPTLLETLVNALDANKNCVLAYVQTHTINDGNTILQTSAHNKLAELVPGKEYIKSYLTASCSIWNASMLVFRKRYFSNVSDRFTPFKMSGDWLFYIEMARQGDVFISGKVLNYFRNHDKDVSGKMYSTGKNYLEEIEILKILANDGQISPADYKSNLLEKFVRYTVHKYKFTAAVKGRIEEAFYSNGTASYKNYLRVNGTLKLLQIRAQRRLNMLFK